MEGSRRDSYWCENKNILQQKIKIYTFTGWLQKNTTTLISYMYLLNETCQNFGLWVNVKRNLKSFLWVENIFTSIQCDLLQKRGRYLLDKWKMRNLLLIFWSISDVTFWTAAVIHDFSSSILTVRSVRKTLS